jgi:hypothetical protein
MAFAIRNLSVLAYAQGFTLWHYKAGAAKLAQVARGGFFNHAADMFATGDMLMVSSAEGGRMFFVTSSADVVTTAPMG